MFTKWKKFKKTERTDYNPELIVIREQDLTLRRPKLSKRIIRMKKK